MGSSPLLEISEALGASVRDQWKEDQADPHPIREKPMSDLCPSSVRLCALCHPLPYYKKDKNK